MNTMITARKKDTFFGRMEEGYRALTFDDVLIKTGFSASKLYEISLVSRFSRNCSLKLPLVSAAMDTVTEYPMAVALARLGGIGVIHRNMSPKKQAWHIARVKNYSHVRIDNPISVRDTATIAEVFKERTTKKYPFESFLVIGENGKLVGVLTGQDFAFCSDAATLVRDAMTPREELETAPPETTAKGAFLLMQKVKKKVLPLVKKNGAVAGLYVFSDVKRALECSSMYNTDPHGNLRVAAAIGVGKDELERASELASEHVDVLVLDTAHGDSAQVLAMLQEIKRTFSDIDVVVGNVSEGDSASRLARLGADGVKVGQGPGSICTTRSVTGTGCTQLTAIHQCEYALRGSGVPVCADGGVSKPAHLTIALAAGAGSVMMGRMFAGTEESAGEVVTRGGQRFKEYRGMGSPSAMRSSRASRERYGQTSEKSDKFAPEGVEALVPFQGSVEEVVRELEGWLRSAFGYVGAASVGELHEKADFRVISPAGRTESDPHDVILVPEIADAPWQWQGMRM